MTSISVSAVHAVLFGVMYLRRLDLSPDGPPPPAHYIIFVIIFIYIFCAVHLRMVLGRHYCCSGRVPGER